MKPRALTRLFPSMVADYSHALLARLQIHILLRLTPLPASARILLLSPTEAIHVPLVEYLPQADIHWHPLHSSTQDIPLPAHQFDAILVLAALYANSNWRTILTEAPRLLRHGGLLYIGTCHTKSLTRAALRGHLAHHGFAPLSTWPAAATHRLAKWLANAVTLSVFRLNITQPEYD
ncbi:MAG: hypothetical protein DI585_05170 [Pseudomonas fluorescens]|nr:MAG: hypothetical protein DI585_05170 [Pseudomonas fluorescens]